MEKIETCNTQFQQAVTHPGADCDQCRLHPVMSAFKMIRLYGYNITGFTLSECVLSYIKKHHSIQNTQLKELPISR